MSRMTAQAAQCLQDADPEAWKGEKKPDPTPTELKLGRAALNFASADEALRGHVANHCASGLEYAWLLAVREAAWTRLLDVAWGFPPQPRTFEGGQ